MLLLYFKDEKVSFQELRFSKKGIFVKQKYELQISHPIRN